MSTVEFKAYIYAGILCFHSKEIKAQRNWLLRYKQLYQKKQLKLKNTAKNFHFKKFLSKNINLPGMGTAESNQWLVFDTGRPG